MVITPWGDSGSLRERQLRPVRGTPADEVERNQRERLFAAMVACVAERGFAATTVEDLVELSGVSRRSFYDYFGDKAGCLREAMKEVMGIALRELGKEGDEDFEELSLRRYMVLAELAVSQPAASKVILNDVFAAGPEAVEPVVDALHEYERLIRESSDASPPHAGVPMGVITARLGGVVEVSRAKLRRGRADELPGLGRDIVAMSMADRPPPVPLRPVRGRSKPEPESLDAADHSERAIRAFATLVAERGYSNVSVDDVVRLASMSGTTFYANFSGKDDLMAAAIESACAGSLAAVAPAFSSHTSWPEAVRAGYGALLNFLASRPALATLLTVGVYAAGDDAVERRNGAVAPLGALIENNTTPWPTTPPVVFEMIAGGFAHLLYETVTRSGPEALPALAPICTYITLSPFIGPEKAGQAANEEGPDGLQDIAVAAHGPSPIGLTEPMRVGASLTVQMAGFGPVTVAEIAATSGDSEARVSGYVAQLESIGALERTGERDGETLYRMTSERHPLSTINTRQMEAMSPEERNTTMAYLWTTMRAEIDRHSDRGGFGRRADSFLTRTPMVLDDRGWDELTHLHEEALFSSIEIAERSKKRLEESGNPGIQVRVVQVVFDPNEE